MVSTDQTQHDSPRGGSVRLPQNGSVGVAEICVVQEDKLESRKVPSIVAGLPKAIANYMKFLEIHGLSDNRISAAVYQVHEDLRLIRGWSKLRVLQSTRLGLLGVAAPGFDSVFPESSDGTMDRIQAVIPIATEEQLTPRMLSEMCSTIRHPDTGACFRCVTVAIVDQDSTTAYYRVFTNFEEIVHPQWKQKKSRSLVPNAPGAACDDDEMLLTKGGSSSDSASSYGSGSESD
jgi:Sen15 protein